ncbi:class I SAM-dependent methyltransferase [Clostridioides sp. ZZV15-6383]|uniref:class I SAM-dependent methyltransferase n=1 Tax=Clostridioides sp. ZZV15-6383 TaxID=2811498 RepID=UPI001D113CF0|nr:class I SAM-dependent methyltransferase [Clostridioides sp. ZZV15-6383]
MDNSTRIYEKHVDIKKDTVQEFWNRRAKKHTPDNPYISVKCNDQNPDYANTLDKYEKEIIIPKLNITRNSNILDIGCGVGRLADYIVPICNYYLGTDFAEDLIAIAKKRFPDNDCDFQVCDFTNTPYDTKVKSKMPFDTILLAGVTMYINDDELKIALKNLLGILDKKASIYLSIPIGINKRLTLKEFYSKELNSEYNVIYRTIEEYEEILKPLLDEGFEIVESKSFLTDISQYSDTERHYFILKR